MKSNTSRILLAALMAIYFALLTTNAWAVSEHVLRAFTGIEGANPTSLVADSDGNLFGTASIGGNSTNPNCQHSVPAGCGTVFELSPTSSDSWTVKVLHNFSGGNDGSLPLGLVRDAAGNLFGVTQRGGGGNIPCVGGRGCGTVFELSPTSTGWKFKTLHIFSGLNDGTQPDALALDAAGNLYISAEFGGNSACGGLGCGTIFELSPTPSGWKGRALRIFDWSIQNPNGAAHPQGPVVFDAAGNLQGAAGNGVNDSGVVYQLTPTQAGQWKETELYSFCPDQSSCADGSAPMGLTVDSTGHLFGATLGGGSQACDSGCGVVFELSQNGEGRWIENVLFAFGGAGQGANPVIAPILDAAGNLFGTTFAGFGPNCVSSDQCGVLFKLTHTSGGTWEERVLHHFTGAYDGANPSNLIFNATGQLFGTTAFGGANTTTCPRLCGVVYEFPH